MDSRNQHKRTKKGVPARVVPALGLLLEAMQYAKQTSGDPWEFSVELEQLTALGLTRNDFRWLVRKGLVEHQREVTLDGDNGRAFRPTGDLTFPEGTCFILTGAGASIACGSYAAETGAVTSSSSSVVEKQVAVTIDRNISDNEKPPTGKPDVPTWDSQRRELSINGITVKRYLQKAPNQEAVLAAFDEEAWPHRIDDPLSPQPGQDTKRRLCDTIKCLNRRQTTRLIHFHGDGSGEGIMWELVDGDGSNEQPRP